MSRIAFLGLGNMGMPMAINLAKAGHEVIGFDIVPAARDAFEAHGNSAATIGEAVARAEFVVTMLPAVSTVMVPLATLRLGNVDP